MTRTGAVAPLFAALLLALVLSTASLTGCSEDKPATAGNIKAPDFMVKSLNGNTIVLSELKGDVLLLDFWATWCPPCRESVPHLNKLQQKYGSSGLKVIGLSLDENVNDLISFVGAKRINYQVARADKKTKSAYRVSSIPNVFLVDKKGNIRESYLGFNGRIAEDMESKIRMLLAEK